MHYIIIANFLIKIYHLNNQKAVRQCILLFSFLALQYTRRRKQCKSLQVAIGCFREKVYYTLSESRALSSPIGNRYSGRSRGLSQMRQVVPYRRSLFRRSAMNCLSPYAHLAPYGCRLRQLSRSCCRRSLEDVNCEAKLLSQRGQSQADFALSVRFLIFYFLDFGVDPHTQ